ncbi:Lim domain [Entamoeba marina]
MNTPLVSTTLHEQIKMYPETITEYIEHLKQFKEYLDAYNKRTLQPLGFYNMMLRTKQQNYNIPEYEIDSIIPNYSIISDIHEDIVNTIVDAIDLAKTTKLEMEDTDVYLSISMVTNEILDSFIGLMKRFNRSYILLWKNTILNIMDNLKKIQKQSEARSFGLEQLLEDTVKHPSTFLVAFERLFGSVHTGYEQTIFKNLNDHKIVAQTRVDVCFTGGINTEEIYDENRRLLKTIDCSVVDVQMYDVNGSPMDQTLFSEKESKECRFFIFNDSVFMTTPPKRSVFSTAARTAIKGILFKKKFFLTKCTVSERLDNREKKKFYLDLVEDIPLKTFLTLEFETDPQMQQFIQNILSAKVSFIKTQCFGVTPHDYLKTVKTEKNRVVPRFFSHCIDVVRSRGITEEGIFRISSEQKSINRMISRIDSGDCFFELQNAHDAANLVKTYLRTLPRSIAGSFLEDFLMALEEKEPSNAMRSVLEEMPRTSVAMMYLFVCALKDVEKNKEINKMGIDNLCIVVAPTFFWKKGEMQKQNGFEIVQYMVNHIEIFDIVSQEVDNEVKKDHERVNREKERFADHQMFAFEKAVAEERKRMHITDEKPTISNTKKKELERQRRLQERAEKERQEEERKQRMLAEMEQERLEAIERQKEIDRLEEQEALAKIERERKRAEIEEEMAKAELLAKQQQAERERLRIEEENRRNAERELELQRQKEELEARKKEIRSCCCWYSLNAGKRLVHERCFVCKECKRSIDGKFVWRENGFVCGECVSKAKPAQETGNGCGKCGLVVEGKIIKAMGKVWHPECFVCAKCSGKIAGGFVNWDGKPVCKNCKDSL